MDWIGFGPENGHMPNSGSQCSSCSIMLFCLWCRLLFLVIFFVLRRVYSFVFFCRFSLWFCFFDGVTVTLFLASVVFIFLDAVISFSQLFSVILIAILVFFLVIVFTRLHHLVSSSLLFCSFPVLFLVVVPDARDVSDIHSSFCKTCPVCTHFHLLPYTVYT